MCSMYTYRLAYLFFMRDYELSLRRLVHGVFEPFSLRCSWGVR